MYPATTVLPSAIAAGLICYGVIKIQNEPSLRAEFEHVRLPRPLLFVLGAVELAGAAALRIGVGAPAAFVVGSGLVALSVIISLVANLPRDVSNKAIPGVWLPGLVLLLGFAPRRHRPLLQGRPT